jgi:hypothetical protein
MKVQHNVKLLKRGRKDVPPDENWIRVYAEFPIDKLKPGYSFNTGIDYEYGKTISIKNSCRRKASKLGKRMSFSVGEWKGKIRVWRTK